jgi:hypothetical protein
MVADAGAFNPYGQPPQGGFGNSSPPGGGYGGSPPGGGYGAPAPGGGYGAPPPGGGYGGPPPGGGYGAPDPNAGGPPGGGYGGPPPGGGYGGPPPGGGYGGPPPGGGYGGPPPGGGYGAPAGGGYGAQPAAQVGGGYGGMPGGAAPMVATGGRGPIGQTRNPVMVLVIGYVTCGIYMMIQMWGMLNELKAFRGKDDFNPILILLFPLFFIWPIPAKVLEAKQMAGVPNPQVASPILYLLLSPYFLAADLNEVWQAAGGGQPPR